MAFTNAQGAFNHAKLDLIIFWRLICLNSHQISFILYGGHVGCIIIYILYINIYIGFDEKGTIQYCFSVWQDSRTAGGGLSLFV